LLAHSNTQHTWSTAYTPLASICCGFELVAWRSGNALCPISKVALRQAGLVLGWVTACSQVNHLGMYNQPPRLTQPFIPPG